MAVCYPGRGMPKIHVPLRGEGEAAECTADPPNLQAATVVGNSIHVIRFI